MMLNSALMNSRKIFKLGKSNHEIQSLDGLNDAELGLDELEKNIQAERAIKKSQN